MAKLTALQITALSNIARVQGFVGPAYAEQEGVRVRLGGAAGYFAGVNRRGGAVTMYRATFRGLLIRGLIEEVEVTGYPGTFIRLTEEGRAAAQ